MEVKNPAGIDEYISGFTGEIQEKLEQMRATIKKVAPQATEVISYGMPAFKLNGLLVWFAAHTKHVGLYPKALAIEVFKKELSAYKCSKGAIQFPLGQPLPVKLITEIVRFRVEENLRNEKAKKR
jgi:uncharacterized protein YdhG (YjbR/CyaY superfamily)